MDNYDEATATNLLRQLNRANACRLSQAVCTQKTERDLSEHLQSMFTQQQEISKFYEPINDDANFTKSFMQRDPATFTDFSHFPESFASIEEALQTYNRLGLQLKTQFRKYNIRRTREGFATMFTICCHLRQHGLNKLNYVQLKRKETFECPVQVKFKWNPDRLQYVRCRTLVMQHTHALRVKDRCSILYDPKIHQDMQLWIKCGLAVCQITRALQAKYKQISQKITYADVYNLSKQYQNTQEQVTEHQQLVLTIKKIRDQGGWVAWQTNSQNEICALIFKTCNMIDQYNRFGQVLFFDLSISKKKKSSDTEQQYHILIISGVSAEGSNTLFGCAVLEDTEVDSLAWAINQFAQDVQQPETIIVSVDDCTMVQALEAVYQESQILFCQNSIKQKIQQNFGELRTRKHKSSKDLYDLLHDIVKEQCPDRFTELQDLVFDLAHSCLDDNELKTLQHLFAQKHMWSNAYCPQLFTCGTHNLNRAAQISKLLNSRLLSSGASLLDIVNLTKNQTEFNTQESLQSLNDQHAVYHHPILRYLRANLSNYAFQICVYQYMFCHNLTVKKSIKGLQVQQDQIYEDSYCTCTFFSNYGLPCCHLFANWNIKQIKSVPLQSIKPRWLRQHGVEEANIKMSDFRSTPQTCHSDQYKLIQHQDLSDGCLILNLK